MTNLIKLSPKASKKLKDIIDCKCHCHNLCPGAYGGWEVGDAKAMCLCLPRDCKHCKGKPYPSVGPYRSSAKQTLRDEISKILVKWSMPTRQIAINEILSLFSQEEQPKECDCTCHYHTWAKNFKCTICCQHECHVDSSAVNDEDKCCDKPNNYGEWWHTDEYDEAIGEIRLRNNAEPMSCLIQSQINLAVQKERERTVKELRSIESRTKFGSIYTGPYIELADALKIVEEVGK